MVQQSWCLPTTAISHHHFTQLTSHTAAPPMLTCESPAMMPHIMRRGCRGDAGPQNSRGARHTHQRPGAPEEPLHVFISADNQSAVDQAVELIDKILQPPQTAAITSGENGVVGASAGTAAAVGPDTAVNGEGATGEGAPGDPAAAAAAAAAVVRAKVGAAGATALAGASGQAGGGEWQWSKGAAAAAGAEAGPAAASAATDGTL